MLHRDSAPREEDAVRRRARRETPGQPRCPSLRQAAVQPAPRTVGTVYSRFATEATPIRARRRAVILKAGYEREAAMEHEQSFEEIVEERRRAWSAAAPVYAPIPAVTAGAVDAEPPAFLEDTIPLPRYRPERL